MKEEKKILFGMQLDLQRKVTFLVAMLTKLGSRTVARDKREVGGGARCLSPSRDGCALFR